MENKNLYIFRYKLFTYVLKIYIYKENLGNQYTIYIVLKMSCLILSSIVFYIVSRMQSILQPFDETTVSLSWGKKKTNNVILYIVPLCIYNPKPTI